MLTFTSKKKKKNKYSHEICLQRIQNDKLSSYEELLEKDRSDYVHHQNIQNLAITMLQPNHSQSREIVTDIFKQITKKYNFRHIQDFKITSMNTKYHGSERTSYFGPKI